MVTYRNPETPTGAEDPDAIAGRESADIGAWLVVDADPQVVRGTLFDSVEGVSRFIASAEVISTQGAPIADLSVAVRQVTEVIKHQTGMHVALNEDDNDSITGIAFTGYVASPLRVAVVPTGHNSLSTVLLATARATPSVVELLDASVRTEDGVLSSTMLESRLRGFQPDVVILLEGDRAQSEWASATGTFGNLLGDHSVAQLIVLATEDFQQHVIQTIGEAANLTGLDPGQYEIHEVAAALEGELVDMYQQRSAAAKRLGIDRSVTPVNRLRAGDLATRYIARRHEQSVLSVDVSAGAVLNWSTLQTGGSVARPDLDVHANIRGLFGDRFAFAQRLLPFEVSQDDLGNWVLNRAVRPRVSSVLPRDQVIESVFLSAVVSETWRDMSGVARDQIDMVIAGPGFCFDAHPALGVLAALNGVQPAPLNGIVQVFLDPDGLLWAAGAVGELSPAVAADVIENDILSPTATVVVVEGSGVEGQLAVTGKLTYEDGESVDFSVDCGSLTRLSLGEGENATLTLTTEAGFAVSGSNPGEQFRLGPDDGLHGGEVGIIIDARGRIDRGPTDDNPVNRESIRGWYSELGIEL